MALGYSTSRSEPAIMLDIVPSASSSDLPFKFVPSSQQKPLVQCIPASYVFADGMDWVLDSKNRRLFWIPPDRRPDSLDLQSTAYMVKRSFGVVAKDLLALISLMFLWMLVPTLIFTNLLSFVSTTNISISYLYDSSTEMS
jgi:hypothetical protein